MVLPGHLAGGYLAAQGLLSFFHPGFGTIETNALLVIGTLAGDLPDIDLIPFYFAHRAGRTGGTRDHRDYVTHTPLFWLATSLIVVAGGWLGGSLFIQWIGWLILTGSWTHLILDSVEFGVRWLWPLSNKHYTLKRTAPAGHPTAQIGTFRFYFQYIVQGYMKSVTIWLELAITIAAGWVFFRALS